MDRQGQFSGTSGTAVVDSFSLYSIAVGHRPNGLSLRRAAQDGSIHLVASAVALAVA